MRISTFFAKLILAQAIFGLLALQNLNAQNAMLYGMTQNGGADSLGAIVGYNINTGTESLLWSFGKDTDGQSPTGSLVYCPQNGLLYGLTVSGGSHQLGAIIAFNPATDSEYVAWSLGRSSNGVSGTYGDLVWDASTQLFYGMSFGGGNHNTGTVFAFDPANDSIREIWYFGYGPGPSLPYGNLVLDPNNGLYYGMSTEGGITDDGAILTLNPATDTVSRVFSFNDGQGGETPNGSLVWSASTNLFYGMTSAGGTDSLGVLFSFNPADSTETTLHNFGFGNDAAGPLGNLIYNENAGLYYGLSLNGGANNTGAVFSFDPNTDSVMVLYSFGTNPNDGQFPNGSLIYDATNNLYYGMTQGGGTYTTGSGGTIFSFNPQTNAEIVLWNLGAGFDGAGPEGSLLLLNNGFPAGINQAKVNYNINLYPNPSNGSFLLQSQNAVGARYNIYNTTGDIISSGTIQSDIQNIYAGNAASGIYLLKLEVKDGVVPVRFVVTK